MKLPVILAALSLGSALTAASGEASSAERFDTMMTDKKNVFAACILTMDDNFRLIEWLAFHYHVLPLRKLILLVDPRSETSPAPILDRWKDYISIEQWSDSDVFSEDQLADRSDEGLIKLHRSRQRAFNVKCMSSLRDGGFAWTLMTDVDEYTYVNPRTRDSLDPLYQDNVLPLSIGEPGSVLHMLESMATFDADFHSVSPCLPLPRLQFGGLESQKDEIENLFPKTDLAPSLLARDFDTFRWRHYGVDTVTARHGTLPGKTMIDLSRIQDADVELFSGDPHRPIDHLCEPRKVWLNETESAFVANHVLGTMTQYASRDDSRLVDRILNYEARRNVGGNVSDEVRHWLQGFVNEMGKAEAHRLLAGVGQIQTKTPSIPHCSINFFGLPRSFKTMVLPSLVQNVLIPNAKYNCDIFVHYYDVNQEDEGRLNRGGDVDADSILALKTVVEVVAANAGKEAPSVVIKSETKDQFKSKFGDLVSSFKTQVDPTTGELTYFPWKDKSYNSGKEIENIVMQWNSIQSAWNEMTLKSEELGISYERVAFLRSDALYATPIDIFKVDKDTYDYTNRYAVIPGFGKHPVSDRMIYGPADAVRIWATQRFERLEHHIATYEKVGYGMHPERYLEHEIFPAIAKEAGFEVVENIDICFYRARPSNSVLITDCVDEAGGMTRGFQDIDQKQLVENLVKRDCREIPFDDVGRFIELRCDKEAQQVAMSMRRSLVSPSMMPTFEPTEEPVITPAPTSSPTKKKKKKTNDKQDKKMKGSATPSPVATPPPTPSPVETFVPLDSRLDAMPDTPSPTPSPTPAPVGKTTKKGKRRRHR